MRADLSRDSYDPLKRYYRVLMQQGRVQMDADWNEQAAILLHRLECLITDLVGPGAGRADSFEVAAVLNTRDFTVSKGRYYAEGLLIESFADLTFSQQAGVTGDTPDLKASQPYLVYIDAWEELVTGLQDPDLTDVALGGLDTTARTRVAWRVRTHTVSQVKGCKSLEGDAIWRDLLSSIAPSNRGTMTVRAREVAANQEIAPCITPPQARYRGPENQLYRVEIHDGGRADEHSGATFKWSRENGSMAVAVLDRSEDSLTLSSLGQDRAGIQVGDWVEVTDDTTPLGPLFRVVKTDVLGRRVTLDTKGRPPLINIQADLHPVLRRWDQKPGAENVGGLKLRGGVAVVREGANEENWLALEDGIEVQFRPAAAGEQSYQPGDYWVFAARTANGGEVVWPTDDTGKPVPQPPKGVRHRYAPLAMLNFDGNGDPVKFDCRQLLPLTSE